MNKETHNPLAVAKSTILEPAGLSEVDLEKLLGQVMGKGIDHADLYFQTTREESWLLENSMIKEANYHSERGVGVRAMSGEKTGFSYSDDIVMHSLEEAATAARSIARQGETGNLGLLYEEKPLVLYSESNPILSMTDAKKVELLHKLDQVARQCDPRVKEVFVSLAGSHEVILVSSNEGQLAADVRPMVRVNISVIVEQDGRREHGTASGGCRGDYHFFLQEKRAIGYAKEAVRKALINLESVKAPAGVMPVVLGPGWPGVLLHEAVGHGLEGDFNRKGSSAFSGRIGERVANPCCTVVDDGTIEQRRGSLQIDDEGVPTQNTVLIENGILKGYMQDKQNARLMGVASTGNGRRESYTHFPMPRMTNTYMLAGQHDPGEIIESVNQGIYAVDFSGGQVDITSGKFVFTTSEAYLIENGRITTPLKNATLIGNGPDVLTKVSMVGNDLALDSGIGVCGKDGQSVPVGVGQPTLKIDELTVGGTQ